VKGTVHSLRGLTQLVEARVAGAGVQREAFEGLRMAIDRLEEITRMALTTSPDDGGARTSGAELAAIIEAVITEVSTIRPDVRWAAPAGPLPAVRMPAPVLREILLALAHNGAEAARGQVTVRATPAGDLLEIEVSDDGAGLPRAQDLFRPGATTKPGGSGFGLYLARRLVDERGGHLIAGNNERGATFSLGVPLLADPR
jgi:signal transduction histidine kinase